MSALGVSASCRTAAISHLSSGRTPTHGIAEGNSSTRVDRRLTRKPINKHGVRVHRISHTKSGRWRSTAICDSHRRCRPALAIVLSNGATLHIDLLDDEESLESL